MSRRSWIVWLPHPAKRRPWCTRGTIREKDFFYSMLRSPAEDGGLGEVDPENPTISVLEPAPAGLLAAGLSLMVRSPQRFGHAA